MFESVCKMCSLEPHGQAQNEEKNHVFWVGGILTLSRIVTTVETCLHHFEPETKGQSIEWHHPQISQEERIPK